MNLRVVKLGGSLFDLPDLGRRVKKWLSLQPPMPTMLIAGGGMFTDAVRQFDAIHPLSPRFSHQLALQSMKLASEALGGLLSEVEYQDRTDRLPYFLAQVAAGNCPESYIGIWDIVEYWTWEVEQKLADAPLDWTLTSDSIAAILAKRWQVDSFVLLKSCEAPGDSSPQWSEAGGVDPQFARHAEGMNVNWVNLRDSRYDDRA